MQIAIGIWSLTGFAGTESYSLTVAGELQRFGHEVWIYAPEVGPCAEFAASLGLRVVQRESELPDCEAVLAQDAVTTYALAHRFPDAVRVMVAHSAAFSLQSPPQIPDVCHAVVVMNDRFRRRTEALAWHPRVVRLRQPIDLQRFCFPALNLEQRHPPRVLLLSNHSQGTRHRMLEAACAKAGFEFAHTGTRGISTATPEHSIAGAEIVVSLGRGALESMASGRAAYVYGPAGGDGWVTPETYPSIESEGFSGRALGRAISFDRLVSDLSEWNEEIGEVGRDLACTHHDVQVHAVELMELFETLDPPRSPVPAEARELARLIRLEWGQHGQGRTAAAQADAERAHAAQLRTQVADLQGEVSAQRVQAAAWQSQIAGYKAQVSELQTQLSRQEAQTRALQVHAAGMQSGIISMKAQLADLRLAFAAVQAERDRLRCSLDAVHATRTLRWTNRGQGRLWAAPFDDRCRAQMRGE